jgi:hypothetical protein
MRTISGILVFWQGVTLLALFAMQGNPVILALAGPLLVIGGVLATVKGMGPLVGNTLGTAVLVGAAAATAANRFVWLDGLPAALLTLAAATLPVILAVRLSRKLVRVWPEEQLVLTNPFLGGLRTLTGPLRILVPPFSRLLARMPLGRHEFTFTITDVNTRPRAGPAHPVGQNLRAIEVEVWLHLGPNAFRRLFGMPNKTALYAAAAAAVGQKLPHAMLDLRFWAELLRELTHLFVPPTLREVVLHSKLDPYEVSEQRATIAAQVWAALREQFAPLDVHITALSLTHVEFDETEAALRSREELLKMQSTAQGMRYVAEALTEALDQIAETARRNDLPVPVDLLANLLDGVLLGQETSFTRIRATSGQRDERTPTLAAPRPVKDPAAAWPRPTNASGKKAA